MRKKIMTGDEVQQTIRIPKEIHEKITDMAEKERRSFNSEIVLVLQQLLNDNRTDCNASAN